MDDLQDSPEAVSALAERETLQYLLDDMEGQTQPLITTAFWGDSRAIYSQDSLADMMQNGGFLLERQVLDIENAMEEWQAYYDLSDTQMNLLKSLFTRKIEAPSEVVVLTLEEIRMLDAEDEEDLTESRISFEEIGITWERKR
ncbi:hypothetical protein [Paenibacillus xanthanilyticus]|uniref:Uncharacterized protein n=1 Tax=Paenibacillus xanthanilyticus TaxID=1783531 RepID=A0ABV8JXX1_9BACL